MFPTPPLYFAEIYIGFCMWGNPLGSLTITQAKWDKPLNWGELWTEIWRVMKSNGAVILHCSIPFSYDLIHTQRQFFHTSGSHTQPNHGQFAH
jgi:hypothetical protein